MLDLEVFGTSDCFNVPHARVGVDGGHGPPHMQAMTIVIGPAAIASDST
jgi:hypothetical protein